MIHRWAHSRAQVSSGVKAAVFLLAAVASAGLSAQAVEPGDFVVRAASHELNDGVYYINAQVSLILPSDATAALHSRVPLTIRFEVEFLNRLRLWWDNIAHDASLRSQLTYYSLTDRYVVRNIDTDERSSFETLQQALQYIGRIDRLPIVEAAVLDEDRRYDVRVRAVLDTVELPGPLSLLAFWRREWFVESDWLQWRLDDE